MMAVLVTQEINMSEIVTIEYCSKCKTKNYVYLGDLNNSKGIDYDGYKCWKCKKSNIFYIDEIHSEMTKKNKPYLADGQKTI